MPWANPPVPITCSRRGPIRSGSSQADRPRSSFLPWDRFMNWTSVGVAETPHRIPWVDLPIILTALPSGRVLRLPLPLWRRDMTTRTPIRSLRFAASFTSSMPLPTPSSNENAVQENSNSLQRYPPSIWEATKILMKLTPSPQKSLTPVISKLMMNVVIVRFFSSRN